MTISAGWYKFIRRFCRVLVAILGLTLIAWLGLLWYVHSHKAEILSRITSTLSGQMQGELRIGEAEISVYQGFPTVSIILKDVSLRDSAWTIHRHSLLEASSIFVKISPFGLLRHRAQIQKITLSHATIFFYTDTSGYSNSYVIEKRESTKGGKSTLVNHFELDDVHLWYVNNTKNKLFHLYFRNLKANTTETGENMEIRLRTSAHIHEFNFNRVRGSYLHDQDLNLDLGFHYLHAKRQLSIPEQEIRIGNTPLTFGGNFSFEKNPPSFSIRIRSASIDYRTAESWMSPNIRRVLDSFNFDKPITLDCSVSGQMKHKSVPLVRVVYEIRNNTFHTPFAQLDNISYKGLYCNEAVPGRGHGDTNTIVGVYDLKGSWKNLPLISDTIEVTDLLNPIAKAHLTSSFELTVLDDIVGGNVLQIDRGHADADLRYRGSIKRNDPEPYDLRGTIQLRNAGFTYLPRNLAITDAAATLQFSGDNLFLRNITLRSKQNSVLMEGDALHFLQYYFNAPEKISLSWRLRSPHLNLNDFISFAGKRKEATARRAVGRKINMISAQLDRVLEAGNFALDARIDRLIYKKFAADGVVAQLTMGNAGITVHQVQVLKDGGSVTVSGIINQSIANNPFNLTARIRNVNVAQLFRDFDNFGQSAIGPDNLRGRITADAAISGNLTDSGTLFGNSLRGNISFALKDGAINNFEPLMKVGRFAFRKRNLSAVDVKELQGRFEVEGRKIRILPMEIQTSAINMNIQGIYGLGGGTDIYLEIPLRNPEKEEAATPIGMLLRKGRGFVLHLRGQDPDGSGVKIGWDPLKHGRKATEAPLKSR